MEKELKKENFMKKLIKVEINEKEFQQLSNRLKMKERL